VLWQILRATYGGRTWARLLYALVSGPLAVLDLAYLVVLAVLGPVLAIIVVGLPVLAAGLLGARGMIAPHRWLTRVLLDVRVPAAIPFRARRGLLRWVGAALTDPTAWRAVAYLLTTVPLRLITAVATALGWVASLGALTYPIWFRAATGIVIDTWDGILLVSGSGLALLVATPWITRALLVPDVALSRALLGPSRAARLRQARTLAVDDAADRLRRIERDLHDGAQAQLVALAMKLGLAKEELGAGDTATAQTLLDVAHHDAKQALVELRDLARGIHPPALDDGLAPALSTLASRAAMPVELRLDLRGRPAPAIETIAYFTAAELLTNVAKHSHAQRATLSLTRPRAGRLRLTVHDEGVGGAFLGGGLIGLADRIHTVDGTLDISSPPGGPTTVTVELPDRP